MPINAENVTPMAVIKTINIEGIFLLKFRVDISLSTIKATEVIAKKEYWLKPEEVGLIIISIPIKPIIIADHRRHPTLSFKNKAATKVMARGSDCKIAVAFASFILNIADRKKIVAKISPITLKNRNLSWFIFIKTKSSCLKIATISSIATAKTPLKKIDWNKGKVRPEYFIRTSPKA